MFMYLFLVEANVPAILIDMETELQLVLMMCHPAILIDIGSKASTKNVDEIIDCTSLIL